MAMSCLVVWGGSGGWSLSPSSWPEPGCSRFFCESFGSIWIVVDDAAAAVVAAEDAGSNLFNEYELPMDS